MSEAFYHPLISFLNADSQLNLGCASRLQELHIYVLHFGHLIIFLSLLVLTMTEHLTLGHHFKLGFF